MKTFRFIGMTLFAIATCVNFAACSDFKKNYGVAFEDGSIYITMKSPSIGISGINEVSFDGFTPEEIEENVFDGIRKKDYSGNYDVYVTLQFKDSHGNYYNSKERVKVSTLDGDDVKRYANFGYFKGKVSIDKSYPWNHKYHNK